ncbi:ribonuclease HII [Candidatus Bathyarchaeota archaeon]|nr:ribonuclease HII [Candidatus Bathyarchaeota archaeon]
MRVAGVDEAGRGCVIGPLVIAGALFRETDVQRLVEIGVKDSKKLTPKKRETLATQIKEIALDISYFELQPRVIDKVVFRSKPLRRLNYLETMAMAKVLRELEPDAAYVDTCDVDNRRCARQMQSVLQFEVQITCEPRADANYPVTGAASILAKVRRDHIVAGLRERHGDFNSGYPSDPKTAEYVEKWFRDHDECPTFMRASWSTVRKHRSRVKQTRLTP